MLPGRSMVCLRENRRGASRIHGNDKNTYNRFIDDKHRRAVRALARKRKRSDVFGRVRGFTQKIRKTLRRDRRSYGRQRNRAEIFAFILYLQRLQRRSPFGVQKAGLPELQDRYFRRQFEVRIYKRNKPIRRSSRRRRGYTA